MSKIGSHSHHERPALLLARAAGQTFGRKQLIKDNPKRLAAMQKLDKAGKLRDAEGEQIMLDTEVLAALNEADPKEPIKNVMTVRRWRTNGYPGLDE